jgi:hypothetical protein
MIGSSAAEPPSAIQFALTIQDADMANEQQSHTDDRAHMRSSWQRAARIVHGKGYELGHPRRGAPVLGLRSLNWANGFRALLAKNG